MHPATAASTEASANSPLLNCKKPEIRRRRFVRLSNRSIDGSSSGRHDLDHPAPLLRSPLFRSRQGLVERISKHPRPFVLIQSDWDP